MESINSTAASERESDELKLSHGTSGENDRRASLLRLRNELCSVNGSYYAVAEVCEALKSVAAAERKFEGEHGHEVTCCVPWDVHAPGSLAETLNVYLDVGRMINDYAEAGNESELLAYCAEYEREIPGLVVKLWPWIDQAPPEATAPPIFEITPHGLPLAEGQRQAIREKLALMRAADGHLAELWDATARAANSDTATAMLRHIMDSYGFSYWQASAALDVLGICTAEPEETSPEASVRSLREITVANLNKRAQQKTECGYITNQSGAIRPLLANAELALRMDWPGILAYDEFALRVTILREPPPWKNMCWLGAGVGEPWTDNDDRLVAIYLQRRGVLVSDEVAGKAVQVVAHDHPIHPARAFLMALVWDGVPRIDDWLPTYLGVAPNPYAKAVGTRWLIAAVARIFRPGCKADCCLILEGAQGIKKSTALRTIAEPWFTDEISELGSKDAAMQIRGAWVIELSELDAMAGAEVARVKAFMSRSTDRFRPPYGRQVIEAPRQCVFAGTVNHSAYLKDETGGRRFWPVRCGEIKIDDLAHDRDQLLAEAVVRFRAGDAWWLDTSELNKLAAQEQGDRYEGDAWDELIAEWVRQPTPRPDELPFQIPLSSTPDDVCIPEVLFHAIGKRPDTWTQADKNRVARSLRSLEFERYRDRDHGKLEWRYRRKRK